LPAVPFKGLKAQAEGLGKTNNKTLEPCKGGISSWKSTPKLKLGTLTLDREL